MDLIKDLSAQLGIDGNQAEALAGGLLNTLKDQVAGDGDTDAAQALESAVPELGDWAGKATALLGNSDSSGSPLGGLLGSAMSMLGGNASKAAPLVQVGISLLEKVGLDKSKAMLIGPILANFLTERLEGTQLEKFLPFLSMLNPSGNDGGGIDAGGLLSGALGGLLGNKS